MFYTALAAIVLPTVFFFPSIDASDNLSPFSLIENSGYHYENHSIATDDGYILTLLRIYAAPNETLTVTEKQPVILQHGGHLDCRSFLDRNGPPLAFLLTDAGYDVWLPNFRGTPLSRNHIKYAVDEFQYWNFSWDEISRYDLRQSLEYIGNYTHRGGDMLYVGHSLGTTIFYALMADQPEYNGLVKAAFLLGPVVYMKHCVGGLRWLSHISGFLEFFFNLVSNGEAPPPSLIQLYISVCSLNRVTNYMCANLMYLFIGFDPHGFDVDNMNRIVHFVPQAISVRAGVHYFQELNANGRFQYYDFGDKKNQKLYGTAHVPEYNLQHISVPIAMYYGENDFVANPLDVKAAYKHTPNKIRLYRVPYDRFNHYDFLWLRGDLISLLYSPLLTDMNKYRT